MRRGMPTLKQDRAAYAFCVHLSLSPPPRITARPRTTPTTRSTRVPISAMIDPETSGPTSDAVAGFQQSLGDLAPGASAWVGWVTVLAPDGDAQGAADRVRTWLAQRTSDKLLSDEIAGWASWINPAPQGASALESNLDAASQVILRMAQVEEGGASQGQILASIAPGQWNISSKARHGGMRSLASFGAGHFAEAMAAARTPDGSNGGWLPAA